jgi:hypothetical protein
MATNKIPIFSNVTVIPSDTAATNNTLVQRDAVGAIYGSLMQGTTVQSTGLFIGSPSASQTTSFTAGAQSEYFVDASGGLVTVTLPNASANAGVIYHIWKTDSSANHVAFTTVLGVQYIATQNSHCRIVSNGTSWFAA